MTARDMRGVALIEYVGLIAAVGLLAGALLVLAPQRPPSRAPVDPFATLLRVVEPSPARARRPAPARRSRPRPVRARPPRPPATLVLLPRWW